jgi:hypothetical protein
MSHGDADKPAGSRRAVLDPPCERSLEQTHIGSMIIVMMGCEGGGRERICTALPCFATKPKESSNEDVDHS